MRTIILIKIFDFFTLTTLGFQVQLAAKKLKGKLLSTLIKV